MKSFCAIRLCFGACFTVGMLAAHAWADPTVPGYTVAVYATSPTPSNVDFAPDGTMYIGNADNNFTVFPFVRSVGPGGGAATPYGVSGIYDTDGLVYDTSGAFAGIPGSVVTCSLALTNDFGFFSRIAPNQTITVILQQALPLNPHDMAFDSRGTLLAADGLGNSIWSGTNATMSAFATVAGKRPFFLTTDPNDSVYACWDDGIIRVHSDTGVLLDGNFGTLDGIAPLRFSKGGAFGVHLYGISTTGTLYRFPASGVRVPIGTGFASGQVSMKFGPDGALYVSEAANNRVLRIAFDCPGDADGDLDVDFDDLNAVLSHWNQPAPAGTNGDVAPEGAPDGFVNFDDLNTVLSHFGTDCAT